MKRSFLFPGQGAQYPGMCRDFYDKSETVRDLFKIADKVTGRDLKSLLFDGTAEDLKQTENTQIAVTLMNLSIRRYLIATGIKADGTAGFSLGEFSAMVEAGILTEEQVLPMVIERGEIMARVAKENPALAGGSAMAAVIGMSSEDVSFNVADIKDAYAANFNAPTQTVISGTAAGVEAATEKLKGAGARRVIPLKVSGPFHTPLLADAKKYFVEYLSGLEFKDPVIPMYSNVTGKRVGSGIEARELSGLQIISPVKWIDIETNILTEGFDSCIEVGPGKVLTGFWKSASKEISCLRTGTLEETDKIS
ncbi:MAG: ACP S-malonyltransferase [Spirochaetales bacterium]|nr:ACP S-malonyltransferase [Spirochaetales bacterium]